MVMSNILTLIVEKTKQTAGHCVEINSSKGAACAQIHKGTAARQESVKVLSEQENYDQTFYNLNFCSFTREVQLCSSWTDTWTEASSVWCEAATEQQRALMTQKEAAKSQSVQGEGIRKVRG